MEFFEFGKAPEAVEQGFEKRVQLVRGTKEKICAEYQHLDVAIVRGAKIAGGKDDEFEFGIMHRSIFSRKFVFKH